MDVLLRKVPLSDPDLFIWFIISLMEIKYKILDKVKDHIKTLNVIVMETSLLLK